MLRAFCTLGVLQSEQFCAVPDVTLHVVGDISRTDLEGGAGEADSSHEEFHLVFLAGKHVLDRCTNSEVTIVGIERGFRHWFASGRSTGKHGSYPCLLS